LSTRRFADARGWFSETYAEAKWAAMGVDVRFVQDNQSSSTFVGTIRGIHFQSPPHAQAKLVRCVRGRIIDYAVDLRKGSPTYGQIAFAKLSGENGRQLFVPVGYGHAFVTLEPDTEVVYKVTDYYAPECDRGLAWTDPALAIDWPVEYEAAMLSPKDRTHPKLAALPEYFRYAPA
jgi:dTDP-4-dehydrorhamnose 3,5-epimerase